MYLQLKSLQFQLHIYTLGFFWVFFNSDTRNVIVVQTMDGITTVRLSFLK
jgi:hypothetical protein